MSKGYGGWLTQPERDAWDAAAEKLQSRPRLGQSGPLTGQMLFGKLNCPRTLIGRGWLRLPAAPVVFGPSPVGQLTLRREHGRLRLELAVSGPVTGDIMVLATPPCRPTWRKCRKPRYLGLLPAPVNGVSDITTLYLERFGEPEPGQRIFVRTVQQQDGWESEPADTSELVPAQGLVAEVTMPRPGVPEGEHRTLNLEPRTLNEHARGFRRSRFKVRSSKFSVRPPSHFPPCPRDVHAIHTVVARWTSPGRRPLPGRIGALRPADTRFPTQDMVAEVTRPNPWVQAGEPRTLNFEPRTLNRGGAGAWPLEFGAFSWWPCQVRSPPVAPMPAVQRCVHKISPG